MRHALRNTTPALAVLALAGQLWAGGFSLTLGSPEASPEARKLNAVLTIKMDGCHDPGAATVTATAIGMVSGERREIPLQLHAMTTPGMYALAQQLGSRGYDGLTIVGGSRLGFHQRPCQRGQQHRVIGLQADIGDPDLDGRVVLGQARVE